MEKYHHKISLWSKILNYLFKFINYKKRTETVEKTKKYIIKLSNKNNNLPKKLGLNQQKIENMTIYSYLGNINDNKRKLLYIHGGTFIEEVNYFQLKFAMKIAKKTNSTLIFPVYPLAPGGNYKTMYKSMDVLYSKILENNTEVNFLGDSAGGGFVLSYAMSLRDRNIKLPKNIIMLSPWLDVSLSNSKIYEKTKKDYFCGIEGAIYCGKLWAKELDTKNPYISPMFGNVSNLSNITIITGENEILEPDCRKFSEILNSNNIKHNFIEYKGQGHDFGIYPTKEGKLVIDDITKIIS